MDSVDGNLLILPQWESDGRTSFDSLGMKHFDVKCSLYCHGTRLPAFFYNVNIVFLALKPGTRTKNDKNLPVACDRPIVGTSLLTK